MGCTPSRVGRRVSARRATPGSPHARGLVYRAHSGPHRASVSSDAPNDATTAAQAGAGQGRRAGGAMHRRGPSDTFTYVRRVLEDSSAGDVTVAPDEDPVEGIVKRYHDTGSLTSADIGQLFRASFNFKRGEKSYTTVCRIMLNRGEYVPLGGEQRPPELAVPRAAPTTRPVLAPSHRRFRVTALSHVLPSLMSLLAGAQAPAGV